MAISRSPSKGRPDRNPPLTTGIKPKSASRSRIPPKRRKTQPAQVPSPHATGSATPDKQGPPTARGVRLRVRGRLQEMIRTELSNLGKAESMLRCLWLAMECIDSTDKGSAYLPDVVEVAADLVQRSIVDLEQLCDGRIPEPLMAALKVE